MTVLGVEGDFDWADISGDTDCPNPAFSCQSELDWFATVRARAVLIHCLNTGVPHAVTFVEDLAAAHAVKK